MVPVKWWKDKTLWGALVVGLALRTIPLAIWGTTWVCTRDECTYLALAERLVEGQGMTASAGWLWAPGYPVVLALHKWVTGWASAARGTQCVVGLVNILLLYSLGKRATGLWSADSGLALRAGRIAAWLYAASLPQAFFSMSLWSEVIYSMLLLTGLVALHVAAPPSDEHVPEGERHDPDDRSTRRALALAAVVGAMVGICVLFRGVAQYMLPVFVVGLLWRRWRRPRAWAQAVVAVVAAVLMVAPYSAYISQKYETFILSDKTLGQMMWLGNNSFQPISFDYGNGPLSKRAFKRHTQDGRPHCAGKKEVVERDECNTREGVEWALAHKEEFLRRMPLRVAQLLNPHSLMTRHLRWGRWQGLPQWTDEVAVLWGAAGSMLVMWVGALGLAARGRRAMGVVITGILLYHVAAISLLAGLTRYRIPLEPLLMIYAAQVLASPRQTLAILGERRWRLLAAVVALGVLVPLTLWFLPAGWVGWRKW